MRKHLGKTPAWNHSWFPNLNFMLSQSWLHFKNNLWPLKHRDGRSTQLESENKAGASGLVKSCLGECDAAVELGTTGVGQEAHPHWITLKMVSWPLLVSTVPWGEWSDLIHISIMSTAGDLSAFFKSATLHSPPLPPFSIRSPQTF